MWYKGLRCDRRTCRFIDFCRSHCINVLDPKIALPNDRCLLLISIQSKHDVVVWMKFQWWSKNKSTRHFLFHGPFLAFVYLFIWVDLPDAFSSQMKRLSRHLFVPTEIIELKLAIRSQCAKVGKSLSEPKIAATNNGVQQERRSKQ